MSANRKPAWARGQWHEIMYRDRRSPSAYYLDHRRRTKATAEKLAEKMRATGLYKEVWLVEVNRL